MQQLVDVLEFRISVTYHQIIFKPGIYVKSKRLLDMERTAQEQNYACY